MQRRTDRLRSRAHALGDELKEIIREKQDEEAENQRKEEKRMKIKMDQQVAEFHDKMGTVKEALKMPQVGIKLEDLENDESVRNAYSRVQSQHDYLLEMQQMCEDLRNIARELNATTYTQNSKLSFKHDEDLMPQVEKVSREIASMVRKSGSNVSLLKGEADRLGEHENEDPNIGAYEQEDMLKTLAGEMYIDGWKRYVVATWSPNPEGRNFEAYESEKLYLSSRSQAGERGTLEDDSYNFGGFRVELKQPKMVRPKIMHKTNAMAGREARRKSFTTLRVQKAIQMYGFSVGRNKYFVPSADERMQWTKFLRCGSIDPSSGSNLSQPPTPQDTRLPRTIREMSALHNSHSAMGQIRRGGAAPPPGARANSDAYRRGR